jgi:hypothetical protein
LSGWEEYISCGWPGTLPGIRWDEHSMSLLGKHTR